MTIAELVEKEHAEGVIYGPFHRHWARLNPEKLKGDGFRRFPGSAVLMPEQSFSGGVQGFSAVNTADFGAINTSAAELNMIGATQAIINKYCAIPPADVFPGKVYKLDMGGVYGNTGTPTMIFTVRWGLSTTPATNTSLGANAAWTSITGTTGLPYMVSLVFKINTDPPGATQATGKGTCVVDLGIPLTSSQVSANILIPLTATVDSSGQGAAVPGITMNLTWSASSASNTSTCHWWKLRSL